MVGALLDAGSSVSGETCGEVPLVAFLGSQKLQKCDARQLQKVLDELVRHKATWNATKKSDGTSTDCRGPGVNVK